MERDPSLLVTNKESIRFYSQYFLYYFYMPSLWSQLQWRESLWVPFTGWLRYRFKNNFTKRVFPCRAAKCKGLSFRTGDSLSLGMHSPKIRSIMDTSLRSNTSNNSALSVIAARRDLCPSPSVLSILVIVVSERVCRTLAFGSHVNRHLDCYSGKVMWTKASVIHVEWRYMHEKIKIEIEICETVSLREFE